MPSLFSGFAAPAEVYSWPPYFFSETLIKLSSIMEKKKKKKGKEETRDFSILLFALSLTWHKFKVSLLCSLCHIPWLPGTLILTYASAAALGTNRQI